MANSYGTDNLVLQGTTGSLQDADGNVLLGTDSTGGSAILSGPALIRETYYGVANGDFSLPSNETGTASFISDDNPLPYFTHARLASSSAGTVGFQSIEDSTTPSGYKLRAVASAGATTGGTATLSRKFFLGNNAGRDTSLLITTSLVLGTATANTSLRKLGIKGVFYGSDGTTSVGTAVNVNEGYDVWLGYFGAGTFTYPSEPIAYLPPSSAAYLEVSLTNASIGSVATEKFIDLLDFSVYRNPPAFVAYGVNDTTQRVFLDASSLVAGTSNPGAATASFTFEMGTAVFDGGTLKDDVQLYGGTVGFASSGVPSAAVSRDADKSALKITGPLYQSSMTTAGYDRGGSSDSTTITTAGTYYALTNAEVSFTPAYVGQRFLITLTGYGSLNTTVIQYLFVRSNIVDSSNVNIVDLGFSRADNFGTSGRGATVAFTKVWTADAAAARKYKLYGTVQTTNGLTLSLAYTQMSVVPLG